MMLGLMREKGTLSRGSEREAVKTGRRMTQVCKCCQEEVP